MNNVVTVSQKAYLERFERVLKEMLDITYRKGSDYAAADDPFKNFRQIEVLSGGSITSEMGILVRMSDKLNRVANLLQRKAMVNTESVDDTLVDLAVYSIILKLYLEEKRRVAYVAKEVRNNPVEDRSSGLGHPEQSTYPVAGEDVRPGVGIPSGGHTDQDWRRSVTGRSGHSGDLGDSRERS